MKRCLLVVGVDRSISAAISRVFGPRWEVTHAITTAEAIVEIHRHRGAIISATLRNGRGLDCLAVLRRFGFEHPALLLANRLRRKDVEEAQLKGAYFTLSPHTDEKLRAFLIGLDEEARTRALRTKAVAKIAKRHGLTRAEATVLTGAALGYSRKDLAASLSLSESTVKAQTRSILQKIPRVSLREVVADID